MIHKNSECVSLFEIPFLQFKLYSFSWLGNYSSVRRRVPPLRRKKFVPANFHAFACGLFQQVEKARRARKIHHIIGWPSTQTYKHIVKNNLMKNIDVTIDDINRAEDIFGKPVPILKGKSTNKKQKAVKTKKSPLPLDIKEEHRNVTLFIDIMFVNRLPFLIVKSDGIEHIYVRHLRGRGKKEIANSMKLIINKYQTRGFDVTTIFADNEFENEIIQGEFPGIKFEICAANQHTPEIERCVRSVKDRCRCMCHSAPFKRYTKLMTIHLIFTCVKWLNSFPSQNSFSKSMSPAKILEGANDPDLKINKVAFGTYVLLHGKTTNSMNSRRIPAIALSQSNQSGSHYFMSINTGKKLHGHIWDELPFDDDVITSVEHLAIEENQPLLDKNNVTFGWNIDHVINFNDIEDVERDNAEEHTNEEEQSVVIENEIIQNATGIEHDKNVVTDDDDNESHTTNDDVISDGNENIIEQNVEEISEEIIIDENYDELSSASTDHNIIEHNADEISVKSSEIEHTSN